MSALPAHSLRRGKAELLPAPLSLQRCGREEPAMAPSTIGLIDRTVMQVFGRAYPILTIAGSVAGAPIGVTRLT